VWAEDVEVIKVRHDEPVGAKGGSEVSEQLAYAEREHQWSHRVNRSDALCRCDGVSSSERAEHQAGCRAVCPSPGPVEDRCILAEKPLGYDRLSTVLNALLKSSEVRRVYGWPRGPSRAQLTASRKSGRLECRMTALITSL
jgi:hypothetical protein